MRAKSTRVLVVVQVAPDVDPGPALATLAATRRVLVRPPSLAAQPVPPGVEVSVDPEYDRAALAARVRRLADDLVIVLTDDERLSPELARSLLALPDGDAEHGAYAAARQVRFLGRDIPSGAVTFAWRGDGAIAPPPSRLPGTIVTVSADVTATIDRLEALATRTGTTVAVGAVDFVGRPLVAVLRRLWLRRRDGIPGLILSILETYGEILTAAQAWERHGIVARRAENESGVPPGFHIWRTPLGSLTLRDGSALRVREALLDATPDVVAGALLTGGRGAVWAVSLGEQGRGVLRWYRRGGAIRHLIRDRYFGWTPRPIRELAVTEAAQQRGVPVAEVLAARVDRLPWGWYRGAIVTREVTGAVTFADALRRHPDGRERTAVLTAVGRAIRDLHDRGVYHRDLNANNILVSPGGGALQVCFIDFDRAVVRAAVGRRTRERELRRLERSLAKLARVGMPLAGDDATVLRRAYTGASESA
jgi:tRNA A-37 threonylcarbamoyl transferase component Bud32